MFLQEGTPVHSTEFVDPILGEKIVLVALIALALIIVLVWRGMRKDKRRKQ